MPIRDDDDLDVAEGLSASRDDAESVRVNSTASERTTVKAQVQPRYITEDTPLASQQTTTPAKSGRGFAWFSGLVMVGLIAACAWFGQQIFELQTQLSENNNALQLERSRVESISAQVHETGSSFEATGNALETKIKLFDSEIRKLWDIANVRNKNLIDSNTSQLSSLAADLKKSQQSLNALAGELKKTQQNLNALTANQTNASTSIAQINKRLGSENTAFRATIDEQAEQILLLRGEMQMLQKRLSDTPNDLVKRVASNEEAIRAIDSGRQQLVSRITQLQNQLDALLQERNAMP